MSSILFISSIFFIIFLSQLNLVLQAGPFSLSVDAMKLYLEVSFMPHASKDAFVTEDRFLEVLKNIPELIISDKECSIIMTMVKHDENGLCDWRDFQSWGHSTLTSFCKERAVVGFEKKSSDIQLQTEQQKDSKIRDITDLAVQLLSVVKLKYDDREKCLALILPGELLLRYRNYQLSVVFR